MTKKKTLPHVNIGGLPICSAPKSQVLAFLGKVLVDDQGRDVFVVATPNPEQVVQARGQKWFSEFFRHKVDLAIPDGMGLVWASQGLAVSGKITRMISERVTGIGLAEEMMRFCSDNKMKVLVVGGRYKGREGRVKSKLSEMFDMDKNFLEYDPLSSKLTIDMLNSDSRKSSLVESFKPALVLVALGAPVQEKWIEANLEGLSKLNVKLVMPVGGALDVWMGKVKRAPEWMQKLGLEWLWRLVQEPWRLRRQIRLVEFVRLVVSQVMGN